MNQEEYIMIIIDKNGLYKGNGEKVNANDVASAIENMLDKACEKATDTIKRTPQMKEMSMDEFLEKLSNHSQTREDIREKNKEPIHVSLFDFLNDIDRQMQKHPSEMPKTEKRQEEKNEEISEWQDMAKVLSGMFENDFEKEMPIMEGKPVVKTCLKEKGKKVDVSKTEHQKKCEIITEEEFFKLCMLTWERRFGKMPEIMYGEYLYEVENYVSQMADTKQMISWLKTSKCHLQTVIRRNMSTEYSEEELRLEVITDVLETLMK